MAARLDGSTGFKSEKLWRNALNVALNRTDIKDGKKRRRLAWIAEQTVMAAMRGEQWAVQEIGNRLDGKPNQTSTTQSTQEMRVVVMWGDEPEQTDLIDVTPG